MSLQTVLTQLSNAIQQKSGCSGPLTLEEMTAAVNNIDGTVTAPVADSIKFYRCTEISTASKEITVSSGQATLANGNKISLCGTYNSIKNNIWRCPATEAAGEYASNSIDIIFVEQISSTGKTSSCVTFAIADTYDCIAISQTVPEKNRIAYIADAVFTQYDQCTLDCDIVLCGDTESFISVFSGYEIYRKDNGYWHQSDVITTGLPVEGYVPETDKIYSFDSVLAVSSIYPNPQVDAMRFFECASYTPNTAAHIRYSLIVSGADNSDANGTYVRTKYLAVPDPDSDWQTTAVWQNENQYKLTETCEYGSTFTYELRDDSGNSVYFLDYPQSRLTNYNSESWVDADMWEPVNLTFSEWQTENIPATQESWSGYEVCFLRNKSAWFVSNADIDDCNGIYTLYSSSQYPHAMIYSNGKKFLRTRLKSSPEWYWSICSTPDPGSITETFYYSQPFSIDSAPDTSPADLEWSKEGDEPGTVPKFTSYSGCWQKSNYLTENMPVSFLKPLPGHIYSADTSIRVRKMYDGAAYPIPSDGLVFYAALEDNYVDKVSNTTAVVTDGTFTTHNGLRCLELDGSGYVKWADNADLPAGDVPYSFVVLVAPANLNDWKCFVSIGYSGSDEICIHAKNGRIEEFGPATLTSDGKWHCIALTRDSSGSAKTYHNGKLDGSGERTNAVPTPAHVCVGTQANGSGHNFTGYIAFAAIYNRELSADEVTWIYNSLMADADQ